MLFKSNGLGYGLYDTISHIIPICEFTSVSNFSGSGRFVIFSMSRLSILIFLYFFIFFHFWWNGKVKKKEQNKRWCILQWCCMLRWWMQHKPSHWPPRQRVGGSVFWISTPFPWIIHTFNFRAFNSCPPISFLFKKNKKWKLSKNVKHLKMSPN